MSDVNIIAIVGSLRSGSVSRAVTRTAIANQPSGVHLTIHEIADVPLYNGDVEDAGIPASVQALHDAVGAADALVFFSPEYNGSLPAVTKNVFDWLTRPPKSWEGTAVTAVVTTPGPRGGESVRGHFTTIMGYQPVRLFETLGIGSYPEKLDENGELTDAATIAELTDFLSRLATFTATE